jgi:hypothetical protein
MKLILLSVFLSTAWLHGQEAPPLERAKVAATQWEYTVIKVTNPEVDNEKEQLEKLGLEGWELVSVVHADGLMAKPNPYIHKLAPHLRYYFKRQKAK